MAFDYGFLEIPVLNNYPGQLSGLITENQCGIAVPPGNPVAFADTLGRMVHDRALGWGMRRRGRE
jgi:hypothetical protein